MSDALDPLELDLLLASFHLHSDAVESWKRWRESTDWDGHVDGDAFALLPEAWRNLQGLGVDDSLFPRFKGIARQAWLANQRTKSVLEKHLPGALAPELILLPPTSFLFTDGTAVLQHRHEWRFAVRPGDAAEAVRTLQQLGWQVQGTHVPTRLLEGWVRGAAHLPMAHDDGERLGLTWRLDAWLGERTDAAWAAAAPVGTGHCSMRCLQATDAMEFLLRQPVAGRPMRWLGDVLRLAGPSIDGAALHAALFRRPLRGDVAHLLPVLSRLLADRGGSPLALAAGSAASPPGSRPASSFATRCRDDWSRYRASWEPEFRWPRAIAQLPGYMMGRWGASSPRDLARGLAGWIRFGRDVASPDVGSMGCERRGYMMGASLTARPGAEIPAPGVGVAPAPPVWFRRPCGRARLRFKWPRRRARG